MTEALPRSAPTLADWIERQRHAAFIAGARGTQISVAEAKAILEAPPMDGWRCFHCGDVFISQACARAHFGREDGATPACQLKGADGGLLRALREAEDSAADAWAAIHSESLDVHRALAAAQSRHGQALTNAEETGYERGIRDQATTLANLRRALAWHGDPVRLSTTREEWQQDVDEAIRWVRDNPEEGRPSFSRFANGPVEVSPVDHPAVLR